MVLSKRSCGSSTQQKADGRTSEPLSLQILSQLCDAESKTVYDVERIVELFHKPLMEKGRGVLSFAQHWTLFSNLATLHESHSNVLQALQDVLSSLRMERENVRRHKRRILELQSRLVASSKNSLAEHHQAAAAAPPPLSAVEEQREARDEAHAAQQVGRGIAHRRNPPVIASSTHHRQVSSGSGAGTGHTITTLRSPTNSRLGHLRSAAFPTTEHHLDPAGVSPVANVEPLSQAEEMDFFSPDHRSLAQTVRSGGALEHDVSTGASRSPTVHGSPQQQSFAIADDGPGEWAASHSRIPTDEEGSHHLCQLPPPLMLHSHTIHPEDTSSSHRSLVPPDTLAEYDDAKAALLLEEEEDDHIDSNVVLSLFRGPVMMHFLAEHMMYTLHCSRTIMPTICTLVDGVRLQRSQQQQLSQSLSSRFPFGGGASSSASTAGSANTKATAPLLVRSGAAPGDDSKGAKPSASDLGSTSTASHGSFPTIVASTATQAPGGSSSGGPSDHRLVLLSKYEKFVRYTMDTLAQNSEALQLEKRFLPEVDPLAPSSKLSATAPLEELLLHLASPLPSLQRYLHAARCLVECQCLGEVAAAELVESFISLAFERGAQEGTLVLDQISLQDVGSILRNMDDCTLPPNDNRVLIHSGRLTKRFRRGRHERLMFVFSDALCYVEELSGGRHRVRGEILLEEEGGGRGCLRSGGDGQPAILQAERDASPSRCADERRSSSALQSYSCSASGVHITDVEDNAAENISHAFNLVVPATGKTYLFFAQDAVQKRTWQDVFTFAFLSSRRSKVIAEKQQLTGEGPSLVRKEVQTLPRLSRLERQRREDYRIQRRLRRARVEENGRGAALTRSNKTAARTNSFGSGCGSTAPHQRLESLGADANSACEASTGVTPMLGPADTAAGSPTLKASQKQSSNHALRASVRRQASLRGSYTAAQWAAELASSAVHLRVRSTDVLDADLPSKRDTSSVSAQEKKATGSDALHSERGDGTTFEDFGIKMPPPAHLRASMGCTPSGSTVAAVLAAAIAAADAEEAHGTLLSTPAGQEGEPQHSDKLET